MHTPSFPSEEISSSSMKVRGGAADIACLLPVEQEGEGGGCRLGYGDMV